MLWQTPWSGREHMTQNALERLIGLDDHEDSVTRRSLLREVTDAFMVAPDRYGRRDTTYFDLLLTRTATAMDERVRRILAMALIRAGAREEHVRTALNDLSSPNGRFLRRTAVQSRADLLAFLMDSCAEQPITPITGDTNLGDGNSLTLPALMRGWLYHYLTADYCAALAPKIGTDRINVLARTTERLRAEVTISAEEQARDQIVVARRTVKEWARRQAVTDDILSELLEARAMTEFIFAVMTRFDLDTATALRMLNDSSFESFAIVAKSQDIRSSVFAKKISGFRNRKPDHKQEDRILGLYDRIPVEAAERAMRFWRLRVSEASGGTAQAEEPALAS